jgi:hypothetical protein
MKSNKTISELIKEQELTDIQKEAVEMCHITVEYGKLCIADRDGCNEPIGSELLDVNGICPECGIPTVDGEAATGCVYSPVCCDVCGHQGCDGSCGSC